MILPTTITVTTTKKSIITIINSVSTHGHNTRSSAYFQRRLKTLAQSYKARLTMDL